MNIFLTLLFLLFSSAVFANTNSQQINRYDGEWFGTQTCVGFDRSPVGYSLDVKIEIINNRAFSDPQPYIDFPDPRLTMRGKVYGKNKLGLNSGWANTQGKFISNNRLILNQGKPCEYILTKIDNRTFTEEYICEEYSDGSSICETKKIYEKLERLIKNTSTVASADQIKKTFCEIYPNASACLGKKTKSIKQPKIINLSTNIEKKTFCEIYPNASACVDTKTKFTNEVVKLEPKKNTTVKSTSIKQTKNEKKQIENDQEGPKILVANTFEANSDLTAFIQGKITDKSEIVSLMIDGDEVSMNKGSFNKQLFVRSGGQQVKIIARDKHGNKSEATVQLVRAEIVVEEDKFDFLDPRKIKAKTNKNAVAIIIGIEDYENTFAAPFAANDAIAFNDFARLTLGIPANNIKLLTNDEAERNDTLKVLRTWLPKKIIDNQTELYVFYSGHGLASEDGSDLYLLPADGEPEILEDTTILRNKIFNIISELNPKRVTMFFDTCYSGATRDEEFLVAAKPIFIEVAEQDIPTNFNIFSASSGRETAKVLKEAKHGLFSYYMMKGLEGEADANSDNQITNGELHDFINKNVSRQANQTPQLSGNPDQVLVKW